MPRESIDLGYASSSSSFGVLTYNCSEVVVESFVVLANALFSIGDPLLVPGIVLPSTTVIMSLSLGLKELSLYLSTLKP